MSDSSVSFDALMQAVRNGSAEAARQLVEEYEPYILRVVRARLNSALRRQIDSNDLTQAVWASFFEHVAQLGQFDRAEGLVAFLGTLAVRKVLFERRRQLQTGKRNVNRARSIDGSAAYVVDTVANGDPTPSEVAIANETWDRMLSRQPKKYHPVLALRRLGHTNQEIAEKLGVNEKTVRRVLQHAKKPE
jgi:RNA polymerase sigma factor (sigma-70 family)